MWSLGRFGHASRIRSAPISAFLEGVLPALQAQKRHNVTPVPWCRLTAQGCFGNLFVPCDVRVRMSAAFKNSGKPKAPGSCVRSLIEARKRSLFSIPMFIATIALPSSRLTVANMKRQCTFKSSPQPNNAACLESTAHSLLSGSLYHILEISNAGTCLEQAP